MTWTININGHDDLLGEEKAAFENGLVDEVKRFLNDLKEIEGCTITTGHVYTNTTGQVGLQDLLAPETAEESPTEPLTNG